MSVKLSITCTGKPVGTKGRYSCFDTMTREFETPVMARDWLRKKYGSCKKQKMYVDLNGGGQRHIGYIYCFKNADWSCEAVEHWWQQDWVEFEEVEYKRVDPVKVLRGRR